MIDEQKLLSDSKNRAGQPLRELLRENLLPHAYKSSGIWIIPHSHAKQKTSIISAPPNNNVHQNRSLLAFIIAGALMILAVLIYRFSDSNNNIVSAPSNDNLLSTAFDTSKKNSAPIQPLKNGIIKTSDEYGETQEVFTYKNGVLNGRYEEYRYSPFKRKHYRDIEGYYLNGKKTGTWKYYDYDYDMVNKIEKNNLILTKIETFKNGELNGISIDYDIRSSIKLIETNYINGEETGIRKSYCPEGRNKGKLYLVQEVQNGNIIKRYPNECECPYPSY